MKNFSINGGVPFTLFSKRLSFRDCNKTFKLDEDLLGTMTNYDFNVSPSNPQDQKIIHEFGKQMNFNIKEKG